MASLDFKGNQDIWISRDFIRTFTNKQGQVVVFG